MGHMLLLFFQSSGKVSFLESVLLSEGQACSARNMVSALYVKGEATDTVQTGQEVMSLTWCLTGW